MKNALLLFAVLILGYALGTIQPAAQAGLRPRIPLHAAQIVGQNGYLLGWDIRLHHETVCSDPYIWTATREIECD